MAVPPGSLMRALRVRSSRGPTFRTAPRGATSGWMKRATGFIRLGRGDHRDQQPPEPLVAWRPSPISRRGSSIGRTQDSGISSRCQPMMELKIRLCGNRASACLSSGYAILPVDKLWRLKPQRGCRVGVLSTGCGDVDYRFSTSGYPNVVVYRFGLPVIRGSRVSGLEANLDVSEGGIRLGGQEEASR